MRRHATRPAPEALGTIARKPPERSLEPTTNPLPTACTHNPPAVAAVDRTPIAATARGSLPRRQPMGNGATRNRPCYSLCPRYWGNGCRPWVNVSMRTLLGEMGRRTQEIDGTPRFPHAKPQQSRDFHPICDLDSPLRGSSLDPKMTTISPTAPRHWPRKILECSLRFGSETTTRPLNQPTSNHIQLPSPFPLSS